MTRRARAGPWAAILLGLALLAPSAARAATVSNTATVSYTTDGTTIGVGSNTVTLAAAPPAAPAVVTFHQYAPGVSGAVPLPLDGGFYDDTGGGMFVPLPAPATVGGVPISTAAPVAARPTGVYHAREPVFIALADANRNTDSTVRESIELTITTSAGDTEILRLQETTPDSGVFAAPIQSVDPGQPLAPFDGRLSVATGSTLTVRYEDPFYATDVTQDAALVDPFGIVFDSTTGAPVDGATVTLINNDTGARATVFGDDGTSSFPSSVVTGAGATDSSGTAYVFPPGGFRFPFVPPGNYRFAVVPPAGYVTPSTVPAGSLPNDPAGNPYAVGPGSFGDVFVVSPGPALNIDIPADPTVTPAEPTRTLFLQKAGSQAEASAGDFIQYRLRLQNTDTAPANGATLTDTLPAGMRYQAGSLRVGGAAADPQVSGDGRTLTIAAGDIAAGGTVEVSYVVVVAAGTAAGEAINTATASANAGAATSNRALAVVRMREPLLTGRFTIVGRVVEAPCDAPPESGVGVRDARLLLDDGTYVTTDADGLYHFEGVRRGTHVVQLDVATLPPGFEAVACIRNTRFAGRAYSQFVEARGGGLWRADFFLRRAPARAAPPPPPAAAPPPPVAPALGEREYTLRAEFDSGRATLKPQGDADVKRLIDELRGRDIARLEVIGHTDDQPLSARSRARFGDNYGLSQARARTVADALAAGLALPRERIVTAGRGPDEPVADNATAAGRARNRRTEVRVTGLVAAVAPPPVSAPAPAPAPEPAREPESAPAPAARAVSGAPQIADDAEASGANTDWLAGQEAGIEWLFPPADHNPRAPAVRVVIKHAPGHTVVLRHGRGDAVDPLAFDGVKLSADRRVAVSVWRGVPLGEGSNRLEAVVFDEAGQIVATLQRDVRYANTPVRAELIAAQSLLSADGVRRPVVAVRLLDRDGRPVRAGVSGPVTINAPYAAWEQLEQQQQRQLAGLDRYEPRYRVEGDAGIARIELAPTTESGAVTLGFTFQTGPDSTRRQELRAWLEPALRDWVVVGFAQGTAGHATLKDRGEPLPGDAAEDGAYTDGQVSLYAKGRVRGRWLLTLAYDSDKPDERERRRSLLSTIDPNEFYTIYGDGTEQRYDAPSQDKLYLKLERGQFYALFGDYETGLTQTQLTRYSRTLNGFKSEQGAGAVTYTAFAAQTPLHFARDEIQGNGTSGLYRLSRVGIVLNSDKVRIETRDRLRSEQIRDSRALTRHLDYDIDSAAGTLFFREPIPSRDTDFNPVFIVAEYETYAPADDALNAGGRVALNLRDGDIVLGVSGLRDEDTLGATRLGGADFKLKLGPDSELRLEGAHSDGEQGLLTPSGNAWLAEVEHHGSALDTVLYARRQDAGFGVGQQNGAESGQQKTGADARVRLGDAWSVQGQAYRQENLVSDATRDAALARVQYQTEAGGASVGAQVVTDQAGGPAGAKFRSEQGTVAANRWLFDRRLELQAQADAALGGSNDSVDFPNRYVVGAGIKVTRDARLKLAQEFTDGETFDSSTTRAGFELIPWQGARLNSTLNQSRIAEFGPRTFGQLGLTQTLLAGQRWGLDFTADTSRTFNESGATPLVLSDDHPVAPGGTLGAGTLTEDFSAFTVGATYRADLWSWNGRAETRNGEVTDRLGFATGFLRQARAGVAFAASARAFEIEQAAGARGRLATADLSWAFRPLGTRWSVLDRLEFRYDGLDNGSGIPGSGLFGQTSVVAAGDAQVRRLVNNLALNRVSREWTAADRRGDLFTAQQRNQWSLYYGSKYAFDRFDGVAYNGYTDLLGLELRHDLTPWLDLGLQASALHSWTADTLQYSLGPSVGVSPARNGWISLGYNVAGFRDEDFDAARYTAQGPHLKIRIKFDQDSGRRGGAPGRSVTP